MPTHYDALGLLKEDYVARDISVQKLKAAYRSSLLKHHPDKAQGSTQSLLLGKDHINSKPTYSVDQITEAYAILSVPKLRAQYDHDLALRRTSDTIQGIAKEVFRTGTEIVDLDDLGFDEDENLWYRNCRCGDARGFVVTEADLEDAAEDGEVNVGCKGCSLWMKVFFGVVEEDATPQPTESRTVD